ncbi:hypothetical protein ACFL01_05085, partial [Planctomycetota bacterium]
AVRCGLDEDSRKKIGLAVDDVWSFIAKRRSDRSETCEVLLLGGKKRMVLGFSLHDRTIAEENTPQASLLLGALSSHVEDVQVRALPPVGQVIRLTKVSADAQESDKQ